MFLLINLLETVADWLAAAGSEGGGDDLAQNSDGTGLGFSVARVRKGRGGVKGALCGWYWRWVERRVFERERWWRARQRWYERGMGLMEGGDQGGVELRSLV